MEGGHKSRTGSDTGAEDVFSQPHALTGEVNPLNEMEMNHTRSPESRDKRPMKPCRLDDLNGWLEGESGAIVPDAFRHVILDVNTSLDSFVKWPQRAELLWAGCDRMAKYHNYPDILKTMFRQQRITCDARSNGPAIMAYLVAGGQRPKRNGKHDWTIHHLYDDKFPYPGGTRPSLRAVTDARHFTQSAGLVAIHPVADALADEFDVFSWRLRAEAFLRFGYDPEGVFSGSQDEYGFAACGPVKVWVKTGHR